MNRSRTVPGVVVVAGVLAVGSLSLAAPAQAAPRRAPVPVAAAPDHVATRAASRPDPTFGPARRRTALASLQRGAERTADRIGLGSREALEVTDVLRDADGTEHVRYDRTWAGLPVVGGDLVVQVSPDGSRRTTKAQRATITVPTTRAAVPARVAQARVAARTELDVGSAAPTKVVYAALHAPVLAWQTTVTGTEKDGTPVRDLVYTDARTGRQLARFPQVRNATGSGHSLYSGTVPLKTYRSSGTYQLRDTTRGDHRTYDKLGSRTGTRGRLFTDGNDIWGSGTTGNRQSAAVDAAYGAALTWDFYRAAFGRAGIRGNGKAAYSRVHFGKSYGNAFWDDSCFCMTYGDGDSDFKPLVSLDVAGHEMTHGVTAATDKLVYTGDAGGLDESTSDVMGTMVEFSAKSTKDRGDYYIGEKVMRDGTYLRRMDDPHADGHSASCWSPAVSNLDPHYSSGVGNHLFYLLAEGTGSKSIGGRPHRSTTCNGTTLSGIGRDQAAAIWYRAMTTRWVSTTSYPQAANGMVDAARELYGVGSSQCAATVAAWQGVKVNPTATCASATNGPNLLSNPGFESGASGWTRSTPDIISNDTDGSNTGSWYAYLNGRRAASTDTLSQTVTVPSTSNALLSFDLLIYSEEPVDATARYDTMKVTVSANGSTSAPLASFSNLDAGNVYAARSVDLSAYAGQTITVRFTGTEDDRRTTAFLIDDTSLTTG